MAHFRVRALLRHGGTFLHVLGTHSAAEGSMSDVGPMLVPFGCFVAGFVAGVVVAVVMIIRWLTR